MLEANHGHIITVASSLGLFSTAGVEVGSEQGLPMRGLGSAAEMSLKTLNAVEWLVDIHALSGGCPPCFYGLFPF